MSKKKKSRKKLKKQLVAAAASTLAIGNPVIAVDDLPGYTEASTAAITSYYSGEKFEGGFGNTYTSHLDYWTLRDRSSQLFNENLYARGLIRRLVTNVINTGLTLEATPVSDLLELDEDHLNEWSEDVENRFTIWGKSPRVCDFTGKRTFGAMQRDIKQEALIEGDVLVVLRQSTALNLPQVQVIKGGSIQTPIDYKPKEGHRLVHGVELDSADRHVAFHVRQADGTSKRVEAYGKRSGRKVAWLVYGCDKRMDEVRGYPLLALILQSLKELDRYRDSAQRKAVVNSILALFIKRDKATMSSLALSGGASRKENVVKQSEDGKQRTLKFSDYIPGLALEELGVGEDICAHTSAGTDINFPTFEAAVINAIAWACEIPPEVLTLAFQNNYSASRGAVNELKLFLIKERLWDSEQFCEPVYQEWLISQVLLRKINAPGLLESWRSLSDYDTFGAWVSSDWTGAIKPSVDLKKEVDGYKGMAEKMWITNERATKELTGQKFSKNLQRIKHENAAMVKAIEPLLELEKRYGLAPGTLLNASGGGGGYVSDEENEEVENVAA